MHMRMIGAAAIALSLVVATSAGAQVVAATEARAAQAPAVPTLAADAALQIQNYELRADNIGLKMAALQAEFQRLQSEASAFVASLQRPGYTFARDSAGVWKYTPEPAAPVPKEQQQ